MMTKRSVALVLMLSACAARPTVRGPHGSASIDSTAFSVDECGVQSREHEQARSLTMSKGQQQAQLIRSATGASLIIKLSPTSEAAIFYRCYDDTSVPWDAPAGEISVACRTGDADMRVEVTYDCRPGTAPAAPAAPAR